MWQADNYLTPITVVCRRRSRIAVALIGTEWAVIKAARLLEKTTARCNDVFHRQFRNRKYSIVRNDKKFVSDELIDRGLRKSVE